METEVCDTAKKLKTEEIDRISGLPDEVLSLILSFLSTKQAVATCVLSKRWRSIWTLAPDLKYIWSGKGVLRYTNPSILSEQSESFLRFFWDRIKPLDKSYRRVRLQGFFDDRLGDLVMEIMSRKVRELDVQTITLACAKFHCSLLSSETLVSLKLHSISFPLELSVHLPCLKLLHLNQIGEISKVSIREFIFGCPVLEDFVIRKRKGCNSLPLTLCSSQALVSLKLACEILFHFSSPIHLPRLKVLHLETDKMQVKPECISQLLSGCPLLENFHAVYNRGLGHKIPYSLFVLKSLVSLTLNGTISFKVPFPVHLPRLKIFHLENVWTMHEEFLGNFLAGCPLLEDLHFRHVRSKPIKLPYNLFISETLVSLELGGSFFFHVPSCIHLPCLRFLLLGGVETTDTEFLHNEFLHNLLSGCPVLETMYLRDAFPRWSENVSICIPTLECLQLDLRSSYPAGYKLEIIAPCLVELWVLFRSDFNGETAWDFPNIEEANIEGFLRSPGDLLGTVQNTKVLRLSCEGRGHGRLPEDIKLIPKFQYLEVLEIRDSVIFAHYLAEILENSPILKKVIIDRKLYDLEISWTPPPLIPHCLLHTLKAFGINYFRGVDGEMQLMNYILSTARMLEEVKVDFFIPDAKELRRVQENLLDVPRCSSTSQLKFI